MKKICAVLFLAAGLSVFAQNRFFYEYKYIPDSANREDVKTEMMLLDIDKNGSRYYSRDKFIADSTSMANLQKQLKGGSGNLNINRKDNTGQVSDKVTKSYPDYQTFLLTRVSMDQYKIIEDRKPEWKILPEKQKIGAYSAQKATASYGGREWIAWFTTEIPFQDGPYKFYGLPGLIVQIEDTTGSHRMTLQGNKKVEAFTDPGETELPGNVKIIGIGGKEIEVTRDQYKKVWKAYVNDPAKNMKEMMMRNGSGDNNSRVTFKIKAQDGKEITDPNQVFREIEKKTKESLAKNNNPIEPDLYK